MKPAQNFSWLDLIRGMAALEVCLSHLRAMFFLPHGEKQGSILISLFYFFTGFAHQAVIIFFVLSGFLISRSVYFSYLNKKFSFKNYSIDRLTRLWIVILPGLILTAIVDHLGLSMFPGSAIYSNAVPFLGDISPGKYLNGGVFLGNVFFLQTILVHTFGSNYPLWSLANEFWYYVLFPFTLFAFIDGRLMRKSLFGILALAILIFVGKAIALYFLVWLIGFAIVIINKRVTPFTKQWNYLLLIAAGISFLIVLFLIRINLIPDSLKDLVLALVTGVMVYSAINAPEIPGGIQRFTKFFSGISYSLYIIHYPLAILLSACFIQKPSFFGAKEFLLYVLAFLIILTIVFVFWFLFESRYIQLRAYIKTRLLPDRKYSMK